jgi:hypothetical protein
MHRIMAAKTTWTQNTAILWHLIAENFNICRFSPGTEMGNYWIHLHLHVMYAYMYEYMQYVHVYMYIQLMYVCTYIRMYEKHYPPGQWMFTYLVKKKAYFTLLMHQR